MEDRNTESPANSINQKQGHISLQPRIESIQQSLHECTSTPTNHNISLTDLPTAPSAQSQSYLLEPGYPKGHSRYEDPQAIASPASSSEPPAMKYEEVKMSTPREALFVGCIAVSHFMTQAGIGQVLAPIDIIAATFNTTNPGEKSWFIAGYSLTVGTFILISGRLGDIMGHKRIFCFGYAWLGIWSCFAGFSAYPQRQIFFDICRAMQGIGPALLMTNGLALFGRAYSPGIKNNIVFSIFGAVAPAGFVGGATFGALFAQKAWWPWAFWSYAAVAFALCTLSLMAIPGELADRPHHSARLGFDWTGSLLGVTSLVLVNVAWNNGPLQGWATPHVYSTLIIGLLCLVAFVWVERRAANPLLPLNAMTSSIWYVLACEGVGWGSFGVWVFYVCRWLALFRGVNPLGIAAQYLPAVLMGLVAAGMTGFMLTHTPVSFVMFTSMIAFFVGIVTAATMTVQQIYWAQLFLSILIMPFGMDMSFPAATVILSNHMPREHQGLAASLVNTVVNYSISIALGIAVTVEVSILNHKTDISSLIKGMSGSFCTAIVLSAAGVVLGAMYFIRSFMREGWKVMNH